MCPAHCRIADYAPFNIDVTNMPPPDLLSPTYTRVVIGKLPTRVKGDTCGAFTNSTLDQQTMQLGACCIIEAHSGARTLVQKLPR